MPLPALVFSRLSCNRLTNPTAFGTYNLLGGNAGLYDAVKDVRGFFWVLLVGYNVKIMIKAEITPGLSLPYHTL